jgi:hypothetical protein
MSFRKLSRLDFGHIRAKQRVIFTYSPEHCRCTSITLLYTLLAPVGVRPLSVT